MSKLDQLSKISENRKPIIPKSFIDENPQVDQPASREATQSNDQPATQPVGVPTAIRQEAALTNSDTDTIVRKRYRQSKDAVYDKYMEDTSSQTITKKTYQITLQQYKLMNKMIGHYLEKHGKKLDASVIVRTALDNYLEPAYKRMLDGDNE